MSDELGHEEDVRKQFVETLLESKKKFQADLKEVDQMIQQIHSEIQKLNEITQHSTAHLNVVKAQMDSLPRQDIARAYDEMLESHRKMLTMRGRYDKLQAEKAGVENLISLIQEVIDFLKKSQAEGSGNRQGGTVLLEKLIDAQEAERQRLSRQMHDGPAQALSNFVVQTEIASRLFDIDPARAKQELENLKAAALSTFQKVRLFITDLRPMMLDDLGLIPTLRRYVENFQNESGIEIKLDIAGSETRLASYVEVLIFRALQEIIGNAARHNADLPRKIKIEIQITIDSKLIRVQVRDDGKGFDASKAMSGGGLGLKLIKERVEMLGGYFSIESRPGAGTVVSFQIPNSIDVLA
ncbi:MAG: sensor histidine kinase [Chloroflexota bacterium]